MNDTTKLNMEVVTHPPKHIVYYGPTYSLYKHLVVKCLPDADDYGKFIVMGVSTSTKLTDRQRRKLIKAAHIRERLKKMGDDFRNTGIGLSYGLCVDEIYCRYKERLVAALKERKSCNVPAAE